MIYLDAGTTYSKIISDEKLFEDEICEKDGKHYFILPSNIIKSKNLTPERSCGHMANASENEIIAQFLIWEAEMLSGLNSDTENFTIWTGIHPAQALPAQRLKCS